MDMAKAEMVDVQGGVRGRLVSLSVPAGGIRPDVLLASGEGRPRGMWAREGRCLVHLGMAASLSVPSIRQEGSRFGSVWRQARELLAGAEEVESSPSHAPSPRFFGGFSFAGNHEGRGVWAPFPSAFFVLPEVELAEEDGNGDGMLTLRSFAPHDMGTDEVRKGLARRLEELRALRVASFPAAPPGEGWVPAIRAQTNEEVWRELVEGVLDAVAEDALSKVVLARAQRVVTEGELDPVEVLRHLRRENPGSYAFLFEPRPGSVLLGAPPETVATVSAGEFTATAVAGSVSPGSSAAERETLARRLLASEKDRLEHRLCVDDMVTRLQPLAREVEADSEPRVVAFSSVQHLETRIRARLNSGETVLSALESLHPTPAVCGFPRDRANAFLEREEPFERGWYAGPVGWFDGRGNGVFAPALRAGVREGEEWRLFAGAGIVAGSEAAREWEETRMKFQPVLRALAATGARNGEDGEGGEGDDPKKGEGRR